MTAPYERPRRRSIAFAVVSLLAVAVVIVLAVRSRDSHTVNADGETPGFADAQREREESRFELVQPRRSGSTTIPGLTPDEGEEFTDFTTTTTSTTTTTTTTTTLPDRPIVRPEEEIDSLCGMIESLESLQLVFMGQTSDAEGVMSRALASFDRYVAVSPPERLADVLGVRASLVTLTNVLRSSGWDSSAPAVQRSVVAIRDQQPPFEDFQQQANRILVLESATCAG